MKFSSPETSYVVVASSRNPFTPNRIAAGSHNHDKQAMEISELKSLAYWQALCPGLTITEAKPIDQLSPPEPRSAIRQDEWETCKELINEEGYFAYDSLYDPGLVESLADAFDRLDEANVPPIFSLVYDEVWELMHRLHPMIDDLVGDYWMLPAVWAWHVKASNQTAFAPHRDQVREAAPDDEDHLDYLTIWIPLTDLNYLSSCMCVVPASADPDYDMGTKKVIVEDLQSIRMLQGKKGSVFCWTTGMIHWGTRQSSFGESRKSVGLCVQNPEAECFDPPPIDYSRPYDLNDRLSIIGQQIINYSREADDAVLKMASELIISESG